jgi:phosphoribosyl-AMP cyclohydrolase
MKVLMPRFNKRAVVVKTDVGGAKSERRVDGLVSVVVQDCNSGKILMLAYTDEAGFRETLATGRAVYYSTSRNERWCKGETSGDFQLVKRITVDCDGDALIYFVEQLGDGACHTKAESCFYRNVVGGVQLLPAPKAGKNEELPFVDLPLSDKISG